MTELVADCPRCGARQITFDLLGAVVVDEHWGWQREYEAFCKCRHCSKSSTFILLDRSVDAARVVGGHDLSELHVAVNRFVEVERYVSLRDTSAVAPPEYVGPDIEAAFKEGATCLAVGCYNAAATMFRLCIDLGTRPLLPSEDGDGLNARIRRSLGLRLEWLFEHGGLPDALRDLATAVKDDGNEGAHGGSLTVADAEDLADFSVALLERMYTEPERLRLAAERRVARRQDGRS
jgi:hypothetical protein